jgi:hypothetical protein
MDYYVLGTLHVIEHRENNVSCLCGRCHSGHDPIAADLHRLRKCLASPFPGNVKKKRLPGGFYAVLPGAGMPGGWPRAPNVPAVYDVWAGIKGLCAEPSVRGIVPQVRGQSWQNVSQ